MRVQRIEETKTGDPQKTKKWELCFQWCRYLYDDGTMEHGYRFIWRKPETGNLQPARGQARLPSIAVIEELIQNAKNEGWGDHDANKLD